MSRSAGGQGTPKFKQITEAIKRMDMEKTLSAKHISIIDAVLKAIKEISFQKEFIMEQRAIVGGRDKELLEYCDALTSFTPPLHKLLRELAFACQVSRGFPAKQFRQLMVDIAQCYGLKSILSLHNLAKVGLLQEREAGTVLPYEDIRKELKLISGEEINHANPRDIAFAYGGYTPITCKLAQEAVRHNWKIMAKGLKLVPGDTIFPEVVRPCPAKRPVVIVYFVGGVTYSEVAALRLLGQLENKEIVVCTTEMLNGDKMIKSLLEN